MKKLSDFFNSEKYSSKRIYGGKSSHESFDFINLIKMWSSIVGPTLGNNTVPLKIQNKSLIILTGHSAFSEQLSFMEKIIRDKIVTTFPLLRGSIQKIYFKADNNFFKSQKELMKKIEMKSETKYHQFSPRYLELKTEADQLFNDVDEDMRTLLRSIYIQSRYSEE